MLIEVPLLLRIVRVDSKTIFDSDYPIEEDSCSEKTGLLCQGPNCNS
jgi:hypothetical protein